MASNFRAKIKKNSKYLYVQLEGTFDGSSAWELINLLSKQYNGYEQIVIDTKGIRNVYSFGCSTFQHQFYKTRIPVNQVLFVGEKGFEIAPAGSRVILVRKNWKCFCYGNCRKPPSPKKIT
ncbi:MAG: hypothetical protein JRI31_10435 [Deltaproteobacteria bacterium]|nr:hypothetical protein [Deltaproteobacteria bacterium]